MTHPNANLTIEESIKVELDKQEHIEIVDPKDYKETEEEE